MSGIEIAGLVFAGVAAYKCCSDVYTDWRKRRAEKKQKHKQTTTKISIDSGHSALVRSFAAGKSGVQEEYDRDYKLLGEVFKAGDGMLCMDHPKTNR